MLNAVDTGKMTRRRGGVDTSRRIVGRCIVVRSGDVDFISRPRFELSSEERSEVSKSARVIINVIGKRVCPKVGLGKLRLKPRRCEHRQNRVGE